MVLRQSLRYGSLIASSYIFAQATLDSSHPWLESIATFTSSRRSLRRFNVESDFTCSGPKIFGAVVSKISSASFSAFAKRRSTSHNSFVVFALSFAAKTSGRPPPFVDPLFAFGWAFAFAFALPCPLSPDAPGAATSAPCFWLKVKGIRHSSFSISSSTQHEAAFSACACMICSVGFLETSSVSCATPWSCKGLNWSCRNVQASSKRSYYGLRGWSWENWSCRNVQTTSKKQGWENWSCRNGQTTSKRMLLWNERVKLGKLQLQERAGKQQKKLLWIERVKLGKLELQECADNQQKEVIMEWKGEVGKTGVAGTCRQAAKEVIMDWKGEVGKTGAAGMCRQPAKSKGEVGKTGAAGMGRQPAKRSYYGMKGWSWENWSCRNVQASSKRSYYGLRGWSWENWSCMNAQTTSKKQGWENWSCRNGQTTSKRKLLWNERVKLGKLELQERAGKQHQGFHPPVRQATGYYSRVGWTPLLVGQVPFCLLHRNPQPPHLREHGLSMSR